MEIRERCACGASITLIFSRGSMALNEQAHHLAEWRMQHACDKRTLRDAGAREREVASRDNEPPARARTRVLGADTRLVE